MRQRTEQFEQSAVVIGQKSVLPGGRKARNIRRRNRNRAIPYTKRPARPNAGAASVSNSRSARRAPAGGDGWHCAHAPSAPSRRRWRGCGRGCAPNASRSVRPDRRRTLRAAGARSTRPREDMPRAERSWLHPVAVVPDQFDEPVERLLLRYVALNDRAALVERDAPRAAPT